MTSETQDGSMEEGRVVRDPYEIKGAIYSWGKTARKRTEPAFMEVYGETSEDIIAVDLCSSYPHYREIMTGQHRQRLKEDSRRFVNMFINDLHEPPRKTKIPTVANLNHETVTKLKSKMVPKHDITRELLNTAVYGIMLNPPAGKKRSVEPISDALFSRFNESDDCLVEVIEPDGTHKVKGNWRYITTVGRGIRLPEVLGSILGEKTEQFLRDTANYLGEKLLSDYQLRRVDFLSLDIAPFKEIVRQAKRGFPPKTQKTLFFHSAQRTDRHVRADVLYLPFPSNSVSFFSSVEGWPYYFREVGEKQNMSVAKQIADALAPGGRAVFFPWQMDVNDFRAHEWLKEIEEEWQNQGFEIRKEGLTAQEMRDDMTDREYVLAHHSPLFRYSGVLTTLTLSKPKTA